MSVDDSTLGSEIVDGDGDVPIQRGERIYVVRRGKRWQAFVPESLMAASACGTSSSHSSSTCCVLYRPSSRGNGKWVSSGSAMRRTPAVSTLWSLRRT